MADILGLYCPKCGGVVEVEEFEYTVTCPHCKIALKVTHECNDDGTCDNGLEPLHG